MRLLLIHTPNESKAQFLMPLRQINEYRPPTETKGRRYKETNPSWDCAPVDNKEDEGAKQHFLVSHASNELLRHTTGSKKAALLEQRYLKALNV